MPKYTKRITGLCGIAMPPRKKVVYKAYLPMHFILTGNLPAKKNCWMPASTFWRLKKKAMKFPTVPEALQYIDDNIQHYLRPSKEFLEWEMMAKETLANQAGRYAKKFRKYGITFPIQNASISIYCFWKGDLVRDNGNRLESVADVLTDIGIIPSDSWQHLKVKELDAGNYIGEVPENRIQITLIINLEKTFKELAAEVAAANINIPDIPDRKPKDDKSKKTALDTEDLLELGWYGYRYSSEEDGEVGIDESPHPDDWSEEHIATIKKMGYDFRKVRKYYRDLRDND